MSAGVSLSQVEFRGDGHKMGTICETTMRITFGNPHCDFLPPTSTLCYKESGKAVFATSHKLIRVIFAMLRQRTCFREVCV
jgi:hypothetical protein